MQRVFAGQEGYLAPVLCLLALSYIETDKLLYASLILLLCGAATGIMTWLPKRTL